MALLTFDKENRDRIKGVESSFRPKGTSLSKPGRILMGEGHLMKQGRRKPEMKAFFLFNDVLMYGSIILNGRWHKKQQIIPLEDIQLEDMEDGEMFKNQWLIRTPVKSFFVAAPSLEEKRAWMEHIERCRSDLLQGSSTQSGSAFAVSWIPDHASYKCMRCLNKFSPTNRRHHCRKCGFLVCNSCSKHRAVIEHIHLSKRLRVCKLCHASNKEEAEERARLRGGSTENPSSEELRADFGASGDEEEVAEELQFITPSRWLDSQVSTWGRTGSYVYLKSTQP
ncbi:pleckstrin homology domain-containing family F member 2-like [Scomber japonicus]|uniref:pleckstrin homology domain-containing family F member 2-like n=1 Tax=Scomber japonicus TaxID=13676 RepID=UPI002304FFF6|nr:pleckstrin homology domain-containing family F member 2-like [Scomber japonicus]